MTSKDERKIDRKQKRAAHRLLSEIGVRFSDHPTNNIIICNAGQGTGLSREILLEALHLHLPDLSTPKCIIPKGKCYSFVVFNDVTQSEKMYNHVHGKVTLDNGGPKLCLCYTIEVQDQSTILCSHPLPRGLKIYENFIDETEESLLLDLFDWSDEVQKTGSLKNRLVKHYGYEFRYGTNDVDLDNPLERKIPSECNFLFKKLADDGHNIAPPDQLTVNKYNPGHGIPPHVDTHSPFGPQIMSLSLGSPVVMDWRHSNGIHVPVKIPSRSMLIMENEARYDWLHGIASRTWDPEITVVHNTDSPNEKRTISDAQYQRTTRISMTFRWTRTGPCNCIYPKLCDSKVGSEKNCKSDTTTIENDVAAQMEDLHVHQVYDRIASHFSSTRHKAWPRVVDYVKHLQSGTVLLDLGSGNGKNMICRDDMIQIAVERSSGLLLTCKETCQSIPGADCFRSDILTVPLQDQCADAIICIAVLHHFSSEDRRVNSLKQIARLLKSKGTALITVWAKDQSESNYLKKGESESVYEKSSEVHEVAVRGGGALAMPVHKNRTQFKHSDVLVPWKLRNMQSKRDEKGTETLDTLLRYYHVFEEGELEKLCSNVTSIRVIDGFYEQGNWCVVCEKL